MKGKKERKRAGDGESMRIERNVCVQYWAKECPLEGFFVKRVQRDDLSNNGCQRSFPVVVDVTCGIYISNDGV